jgi:hypothetical protein
MDGSDVVDAVREEAATELDRLGSGKALVAATDAQLETDRVLAAAAAAEDRARRTFERWADEESDEAAREAFVAAAATESAHFERVVGELDEEPPDGAEADAMHEHLRGLDDTAARVGGLLGRSLAAERSLLQSVSFFVDEGDPRSAGLFRDLRSETDALVEEATELLDRVCEDEAAYGRARRAAVGTVEAAYREYETSLTEMGVDPKPVC